MAGVVSLCMPKRSSKREDANQSAHRTLMEAIGEKPKTVPNAPKKGAAGGLKGGPARSANLSPEERSRIAKKAAKVRWSD